jgi:hypothetical protein
LVNYGKQGNKVRIESSFRDIKDVVLDYKNYKAVGCIRKLNNYKELYNEDIDRLSESIREYLQEFNDIGYDVKYEALKIVMNNFKEALKND